MKIVVRKTRLEDHLSMLSEEKRRLDKLQELTSQMIFSGDCTSVQNMEQSLKVYQNLRERVKWREDFLNGLLDESNKAGRKIDAVLQDVPETVR